MKQRLLLEFDNSFVFQSCDNQSSRFFYLGMALLTCGVVFSQSLFSSPLMSSIIAMHNKKKIEPAQSYNIIFLKEK